MKNFNKKSISFVLVFTLLMVICMPVAVNASYIGRVGSGAKVTFSETATDSEEVASSTNMEEYINSKKDAFNEDLGSQDISVNLEMANIDPNTLFSTSEPYKYATITNIDFSYQMIEGTLTKTYTVSYTSYTVTKAVESNIIRKTTTNYHTKVEGTLTITGDNTYTKNYSSGEDYLDGNYNDAEIATIISGYKQDIQSIVESYNAMSSFTISEGVTDYYYEAHDEITQERNNNSDVILVGDIDDLNHAYANQGQVTINTILDKYQTYKINATATSTSESTTTITSANITLTAPTVGDKVEKITKNDGSGDYEAQSLQPTVATTAEGLSVNAFWVKGLEELSEQQFFGTFEEDTYYYALIDFEAQDGYGLATTFPDGIKINGQAPDEVFAVLGGKWNHCVAKIKAKSEEKVPATYEFIDNTANQTYTINKDNVLTFRINADYSLFENGGKVFIDNKQTTEFISNTGSTVITLIKDFVNSLSVGEHTIKVGFNDGGEATTKFTIAKVEQTPIETQEDVQQETETPKADEEVKTQTTEEAVYSSNPKTGDNIVIWISLIAASILGIAVTTKFINKRK